MIIINLSLIRAGYCETDESNYFKMLGVQKFCRRAVNLKMERKSHIFFFRRINSIIKHIWMINKKSESCFLVFVIYDFEWFATVGGQLE